MHPELERLRHEFGWQPEDIATWDKSRSMWLGHNFRPDHSVFSDEISRNISDLAANSWWYRERNAIIRSVLLRQTVNGVIWDVGGGTGVVSRFLRSHGYSSVGVEPSQAGAQLTAERGIPSFCMNFAELRLPDNSIEAVSMFDVLEHLPDRDATLREVYRVIAPGGHFILTLPALRMLWSQSDEDAGHYLRYNKRVVRQELESYGFAVIQSGYFFVLTVLPLLFLRALPYRLGVRRAFATEATLAADGGVVGRMAGWIERRLAMRVPFGSSLLVVARKPEA